MNKAKGLGFNENFCKQYLEIIQYARNSFEQYKNCTDEEIEKDFIEPCVNKFKESNWNMTEREYLVIAFISLKQTLMMMRGDFK